MAQYSIVLSPPDAVIDAVRRLKQQLRSAIGWYPSVNALAHLTFNVFKAEQEELLRWETYAAAFAIRRQPLFLRFDATGTFANGAFFLAPDAASEQLLVPMMKAFHAAAPLDAKTSVTPHMSIARQLTAAQLMIARQLIPSIDLRFVCNDIVLRQFNEDRRQYDIYKRFPFATAL